MKRATRTFRLPVVMLAAFALTLETTPSRADDPRIELSAARFNPGEFTDAQQQKQPAGTVENVAGKNGPAVKFTFNAGTVSGFIMGRVQPTAEWDKAAGFSFWVQGDGSDSWGGLEFIDKDDFGLRYGYCFPIDSTDWRKITVRWSDLIPEIKGPLVDAKSGLAPSKFGYLALGKWYYWQQWPAHSFTIDHLVLESNIPADDLVPPADSTTVSLSNLGRFRTSCKAISR